MRIVGMMAIIAVILGAFILFMLLGPSVGASSSTRDGVNDARAIRIHETNADPLVQPYHDIVKASMQRLNGNELVLTVELAGDPNFNTTYESVYICVIDYPTVTGNQRYTIIVPHFSPELGVSSGWHIAIFDNKVERYVVPLESVNTMPKDRVEVNIGPDLIGNPPFFWWQAFVMVRVEQQFDRPPDFLLDSTPDNSNVLLWPFT
ncbi:MAG: hypothetical protein ACE5KA_05640 [Nitrososphaerales archaeon]